MTPPRRTGTLLGLLLFACQGAGAGEEPPPPPPPPPATAPSPAPVPGEGEAESPLSILQAFQRMEALRQAPLSGPGSLVRRKERLARLAERTLALPGVPEAAGEDLHRLSAVCFEGRRFEECAGFAARYLAGRGKGDPPLPQEGVVSALHIRSLVHLGRLPAAEVAMKTWRTGMPGAEGIPAVLKSLGDGYVEAGLLEEAVLRYAEALQRAPRPLPTEAVSTIQTLVEALTALGRVEEAGGVLAKAAGEGPPGEEAFLQRMEAVRRRFSMIGQAFEPPRVEIWNGEQRPKPEDLAGKVVVWHFFAWWMEVRLEDLHRWATWAGERTEKGLHLRPVTRLAGYDPVSARFLREREEEEEFRDVEAVIRRMGWKGPFAVSRRRGRAFEDLGIRGLPMDIVVGRDGKVRFVQAGEEAGGPMARFAAERALAEKATPAVETPPAGEVPPAAPPGEK